MIWLLSFFLCLSSAQAQSVYGPVMAKHKEKIQRRWTLEDVFAQKRKRKAQDLWLSWNRKKGPMFELILDIHGGAPSWKRDGTNADDDDFKLAGGGVQIFVGSLGIGISRDQMKIANKDQYWQKDAGTVFLRLLGSSTQSTHLTILGGQEKSDHTYYGNYSQTFYGALSNLYIFRHMGIEGKFRQLNSATTETHKVTAMDYHWGFFWELSILRVYAYYQQQLNTAKRISTGVQDNERINGMLLGARLYF
ncbi:MAG: hypothetical protein K2P81_16545 [Bacteriovoracaceae bacterium]|nr:hypothetical protein [Bacteriovoracaceae bacterium]